MEDRREASEMVGILLDSAQKFIRRHIVLEFQWEKIPPFLVLTEAVRHNDLRDAAFVKGMDEGAADESAGASHKHPGFLVEKHIGRIESLLTAEAGTERTGLGFHSVGGVLGNQCRLMPAASSVSSKRAVFGPKMYFAPATYSRAFFLLPAWFS